LWAQSEIWKKKGLDDSQKMNRREKREMKKKKTSFLRDEKYVL